MPYNTGWLGIRNVQLHTPTNLGRRYRGMFTSESCGGERGGRGCIHNRPLCRTRLQLELCPRPAATWLVFLQYDDDGDQPNSLAMPAAEGFAETIWRHTHTP